ncbi:MAG: Maf family protein [Rickettsiales bacterium]
MEKVDLFILASSSNSRLKLLSSINIKPDIIFAPNIIEKRKKIKYQGKIILERPIALAKRLAKEKAEATINNISSILFNNNILNNSTELKLQNKINNSNILKDIINNPVKQIATNIDLKPLNENILKDIINNSDSKLLNDNILQNDKKLQKLKNIFILASDSVIYSSAKVIDKPTNELELEKNLSILSGKQHICYTAVCIIKLDAINFSILNKVIKLTTTRVTFKNLSKQEKNFYINNTLKSKNKFSYVYAAEGLAGRYIKNINGSISGLHGLPLCETINILESLGFNSENYEIN